MAEIQQNGNSFEIIYEGSKAGHLNFTEKDGVLDLIHTEVDSQYSGKGLGKELVKGAADYAVSNNLKIKGSCPYAKKVLEESAEYTDRLL